MNPSLDERLAAFQARIDAGDRIEASEWMPDDYRLGALRLIQMHANSEIMGALPEREWVPKAPTLRRKLAILAKVQDEMGHGQLLFRVAEDLGRPLGKGRKEMMEELLSGKAHFHNVFHYPVPTWADAGVIAWLVDGAAVVTQGSLLKTSYAPYARCLERICAEEVFHIQHGEDICLTLMEGTPAQRQMLQEALERWWQPLMHFFGPKENLSHHSNVLLRYRLKVKTNEELRQKFLSKYAPKIQALGLHIPDPNLRYDQTTQAWEYTEPDWDLFFQVVKGNGPKSAERLGLRRMSYEEGQWVRAVLERPLAEAGD